MQLRAVSWMSAVSSTNSVALPAPTPYAGVPELYAARTSPWPPVAMTRSDRRMISCDAVRLGQRDALQDVGGSALGLERLAHEPNGLEGRVLRTRMRREHHDVARLDRVDRVARRSQVGVRRRHHASDDPDRLAVLHETLLEILLDDAHRGAAQRVAKDAADLHPLVHAAVEVAEAGLLDAHLHQPMERRSIRDRPGHGLDETVDAGLVVGLDDRERRAGTGEDILEFLLLLERDRDLVAEAAMTTPSMGICVDCRMVCTCRPDDKACLTGQEPGGDGGPGRRVVPLDGSHGCPPLSAGVSVRALAGHDRSPDRTGRAAPPE